MYQVFISYKSTDENNNRTWDAQMGEKLYETLEAQGIKTFYSARTLIDLGESKYQQAIYDALDDAVIFVAMCSNPDYLRTPWISNEIDCFHGDMLGEVKDMNVSAMYTFHNPAVDVHSIPLPMRHMQAFDTLEATVYAIQKRLASSEKIKERFEEVDLSSLPKEQDNKAPILLPDGKNTRLERGSILDDKYEVLDLIAVGGFGEVYKVRHLRLDMLLVVKILRNLVFEEEEAKLIKESFVQEALLMRSFNSVHIPKVFDIVEQDDMLYFYMEEIQGTSLIDLLNQEEKVNPVTLMKWASQLLDILELLQSQKPAIIHRDIKPGNLIIQDNGNLMLMDFGSARKYDPYADEDEQYLGTMGYAAPEQFGGMGQTDLRTDIFGFGRTIFAMLTGIKPATLPYDADFYSLAKEYSENLACIIEKSTFANPEERYQSIDEIRKDLSVTGKIKRASRRKNSKKVKIPEIVRVTDKQGNDCFVSECTAALFPMDSAAPFIPVVTSGEADVTGPLQPGVYQNLPHQPVVAPVPTVQTVVAPIPQIQPKSPFVSKQVTSPVINNSCVVYICTNKGSGKDSPYFIHVYVVGCAYGESTLRYIMEHRDFDNVLSEKIELENDAFDSGVNNSAVSIRLSSKSFEFDRKVVKLEGMNGPFTYFCFRGSHISGSSKNNVKITFSKGEKELFKKKFML